MDFPVARQQFYHQINQSDPDIDLERAALYLAQEEYPDLQVETCLAQLDHMAEQVSHKLPAQRYPLKVLQAISQTLYQELGFHGNHSHYYDPRNSFLNQVIARRTGIPITLSLVYLAIAKRLDFPMVGINMPGHFLIRPEVEGMEICVDSFNGGHLLFAQDCQQLLNQLYGRTVPLRPTYLEPVSPRQFLARMLANLKAIYLDQGDLKRGLAVIERILLMFPDAPMELRDRGVLYYRLNRITEARLDLESYLQIAPTAEDAGVVRQILDTMG